MKGRRVLSLMLLIALAAAFPVAGTGKTEATVTVWTEYTAAPKTTIMDDWIAGFQKKYPNITVTHKGISNETWEETLRTAMLGSNPPDLFLVESRAETMEYVEADLLYDLTSWYKERAARFIPGFEFNTVVKDKRYAIPYSILHVNMIWYNPAVLKPSGVDGASIRTWDDLMAACKKIKAAGKDAFQLGGGSQWPAGHFVYFLLQQNLPQEDLIKLARGQKRWTDKDVVAALARLNEMYEAGYFQKGVAADTRDVAQAAFFQGQGGFFSAGSWHLYQLGSNKVPPDFQFEFIPFPNFAGAPVQNAVLSTSNEHWAVCKKAKFPKETLMFLDYITDLSQAEQRVKGAQEFLAIRGAVNQNTAKAQMVAIAKWVESGKVFNLLENYFTREVVQKGMWAGAQGVLAGKLSAQQWAQLIADTQAASGNLDF
jgi:raffinose/stachyose/melibiose transport system substrate-binding protein